MCVCVSVRVCVAVIRYDLEFLGLCPCLVDVEIIDAKAGNQSVIVSAGPQACTCQHKVSADTYSTHTLTHPHCYSAASAAAVHGIARQWYGRACV